MITEKMIINNEINEQKKILQEAQKEESVGLESSASQPDKRLDRNIQIDFANLILSWFKYVEGLRKADIHPEAVKSLMRFIGTDLNPNTNRIF